MVSGHPVTETGTERLTPKPLCATTLVSIVRLRPQRLPAVLRRKLAPSAPRAPRGKLSTKLEIGASGIEANITPVAPAAEMRNDPPMRSMTPRARGIRTIRGSASKPRETR